MLGALQEICDGGTLLQVQYATCDDAPDFIVAVGLRYHGVSAVFRAREAGGTDWLTADLGPLRVGEFEVIQDVSADPLWRNYVGGHTSWAWWLTNQRGVTDGVRLEFQDAIGFPREYVELIAWGGCVYVYRAQDFYGDVCPGDGAGPRASSSPMGDSAEPKANADGGRNPGST
jgi:hypothetical protein